MSIEAATGTFTCIKRAGFSSGKAVYPKRGAAFTVPWCLYWHIICPNENDASRPKTLVGPQTRLPRVQQPLAAEELMR